MRRKMNWDQLRHKIDTGQTGDKVRWTDPAIAPLGTDAEAGGASTAAEDIAASAPLEPAPDDPAESTPRGSRRWFLALRRATWMRRR